ncbi:hypothetical protein HWE04_02130 [Herbaspirillum sp. C7C2]|uniref:hypothetical protein n=1 Tax=Herbaspirillum sp. C7C2 TaxID=2736666 RepID=UPI001F523BD7|nr:hypothetical protein [Herbaspirillum sp. C7C2]MCI1012633.1 hypothetical protein [Herbaspirillum sp. C7C2]
MGQFNEFLDGKPDCFGRRLDATLDLSCGECRQKEPCLSAIWAVLSAAREGRLSADNYSTYELRDLRKRHAGISQLLAVDEEQIDRISKGLSIEVINGLCHRVLPPRPQERQEDALEWDALLAEVEGRTLVAIAAPLMAEHSAVVPSMPPKVVSVVASPKMAEPSAGEYRFPMPEGRPYQSRAGNALVAEMKRLVDRAFHLTPASGYAAVRESLCAIHIEMNLRQAHAPRFRPMHRMKRELHTVDERAESLDRQVIDLHWLAHSINKPISPVNNYPTILDDSPFDLSAAERFAQENWSPTSKVIHLHLSDDAQWENAVLQSDAIRKKWAVIERGDVRENNVVKQVGAPQIEQSLSVAVSNAGMRHVLSSIPGMVSTWKARKIAGESPARISRLIALMSGDKPRDRKAVARTIKSLDKYLDRVSVAR